MPPSKVVGAVQPEMSPLDGTPKITKSELKVIQTSYRTSEGSRNEKRFVCMRPNVRKMCRGV